ncbi:galactose-inhibitable lectin 35 kDa subunit precursor, putative [Entamoeba invadens IP1]|uniref:Galactose-inhibitable lectin 35 kDa subunit, putative n=1 Tax=Entamoeba invadens IP1 TaxID=370355 RepID=L7FPB7_ENTIV|nr:galactose-inhibitable lectin 35 kDa subunit precursor, putative [Entamoeba invadens IP1]ELP94677.1 galactose-inhibitable lectin 35 kDa subunit precursor, putative [Entamoeba invadens IP1]|eukprot:XP_004261448.1 galactose-inhibitable lectin 35 kDa subunit precursor, putative [Entamoeba invadens IP1]
MFGLTATDNPTQASNELYVRDKCTTCCRVLLATQWNYDKNKAFTEDDYKKGDSRYFVMDMEFDNINEVRRPAGNYEQVIPLRPLVEGKTFQFFEFAAYKMYTSFVYPKRVHDIRGGANVNSRLIIWSRNPPLSNAPGTVNQRFVYVHAYDESFYTSTFEKRWRAYKYHFFLPFNTAKDLCYESCIGSDFASWAGQAQFKNTPNFHQIKAAVCVASDSKQMFTPVFA